MKLRTVLQECIFDQEFRKSPLVYQGKAKNVVQAQTLWFEVLKSQIEIGTPYMLFKIPAIERATNKIWEPSSLLTCVLRLLSIQDQQKLLYVIWHQLLYHDMLERRGSQWNRNHLSLQAVVVLKIIILILTN